MSALLLTEKGPLFLAWLTGRRLSGLRRGSARLKLTAVSAKGSGLPSPLSGTAEFLGTALASTFAGAAAPSRRATPLSSPPFAPFSHSGSGATVAVPRSFHKSTAHLHLSYHFHFCNCNGTQSYTCG